MKVLARCFIHLDEQFLLILRKEMLQGVGLRHKVVPVWCEQRLGGQFHQTLVPEVLVFLVKGSELLLVLRLRFLQALDDLL